MRSQMLQEEVAFDAPDATPDGYGGTIEGWQESHVCRAHFYYGRGDEENALSRLSARQTVIVTLRNSPEARAITNAWRMRDRKRNSVAAVRTDPVPTADRFFLQIKVEIGAEP